uniref:Uncharacterized protein n=1 Tax=Pithovirus LCPAC401 TaxID=2506595 RepID=A0A481ZCH6_9VIRU|nr:MAG: hypothetical protein LCPAC401_04070 [Pithovirus LCPAC401]
MATTKSVKAIDARTAVTQSIINLAVDVLPRKSIMVAKVAANIAINIVSITASSSII